MDARLFLQKNAKLAVRQKSGVITSVKRLKGTLRKKRYRENRKGKVYEPKLNIPACKKGTLFLLMEQTGMTTTQLFVSAVEEKYGVDLHSVTADT